MLESANLSLARAERGGMTADDGLMAVTVPERTEMTCRWLDGRNRRSVPWRQPETFLLETLIWSDTSLSW